VRQNPPKIFLGALPLTPRQGLIAGLRPFRASRLGDVKVNQDVDTFLFSLKAVTLFRIFAENTKRTWQRMNT
jgi:hypothetical protein